MQGWSSQYRQTNRRSWGKPLSTAALSVGLVIVGIIPVRLAIASYESPLPQAIVTLGGNQSREYATAKLARNYPQMQVWISSGSLPKNTFKTFALMGASTERLHLDYSATDTVTNFTTILPQLQRQNIKHIYLVTSDYHMSRAQAIAAIVLGSHGIAFTPISVPSNMPQESVSRILRDMGRSMFWIVTGRSGSELKSNSCREKNRWEAMVELLIDKDIQCQLSWRR